MLKITKDGKALATMIGSIKRRAATLQADIHIAAVSCVMHALDHNNALPATQLVEAITGGSKSYAIRANALKKWFEEVGCFVWNNGEQPGFKMNAERKATIKAIGDDNAIIAKIGKVPFWEYAPEPEYKGFDLNKAIAALLSRANTAIKEHGTDPKTKIDMGTLSGLARLLSNNSGNDDDDNRASVPMIEAATLEASNVDGTYTVN